jgi:hypothetical protein
MPNLELSSSSASYFEAKLDEDLIPLGQTARLIPSRKPGRRVSISCLYRWCAHGRRGVKLESWVIGGTRYTSRQAIARFVAATNLTSQSGPQSRAVAVHADVTRRQRSEVAGRLLQCLGFGPSFQEERP